MPTVNSEAAKMSKKPMAAKQLGRLQKLYKRLRLGTATRSTQVSQCCSQKLKVAECSAKDKMDRTEFHSTSSLETSQEADDERTQILIEIPDTSDQSDDEPASPQRRSTILSPVMSYYHRSQMKRSERQRHGSFEEVVFTQNGEGIKCVEKIGNTEIQGRKSSSPVPIPGRTRSKSVEDLIDSDGLTQPRKFSLQVPESCYLTRSMEILATREQASPRKSSAPHLVVPEKLFIPTSSSMGALVEGTGAGKGASQSRPNSAMPFRSKRILSDSSYVASRSKSVDNLAFESKQQEAMHYNRLKLSSSSQPPKDKRAKLAIRMMKRQTQSVDSTPSSPQLQHPLTKGFRHSVSMQSLDSGLDDEESQKSPTRRFRKERHGRKLHRISLNKSCSFNALGDSNGDYVNSNVSGNDSPYYVNWTFALINANA